jgi:hypothetical protein
MDPRKQAVRGLLDEFLAAIKQSDKTPIVPAPNRWFAKPEEFPHQQPMIERALAATGKSRDDFLHGAYLDPRTGQDLTGRMMSDVGAVIDPNTGRPVMSGRESGMEEFAELEKRLGNQTLSNLVRRSKFKPTGGDTLLNDIPFITTVESGPHFYGLGMEYASPTQLFQIERGTNPHLRPKSRGDVFGMGEVVGRMQIGKGPEHDVYEKLFVAPRGSDVPGKKLSKAEGGEVHAAGGGLKQAVKGKIDEFLAELNRPAKAAVKTVPVSQQVIKGAQDILPTAEREANLARLLEESQIKKRMYHGTRQAGTRSVSKPGEEGIREFKHGSRRMTFVSPETEFANSYSGAPDPEGRFSPAMYPVYVQAKSPWDYEIPEHIENILPRLPYNDTDKWSLLYKKNPEDIKELLEAGNWGAIEDPRVLDAIQEAGYDAAHMKEAGVKNLGVFDTRRIKSALGNRGTYDINDPDITKATGGEVHMAGGGDTMLADLMERYNTPRNKSRYSAGIFDSNEPGEVTSITPTVKERMASGLQAAMESAGSDRYKARQRAQTILGGPNSRLPGGFGVADIGAMVNPVVAAGMIPVYAESAMHDLAGVPDALKRGDYVGAGVDTAFGLMDLIPAVGQGKRVAKGVAKGIKNAATSDAGYNLAQNVLKATGTAPAQIMMGKKSRTWNPASEQAAVDLEKQGTSTGDIWRGAGNYRGANHGEWRQEIPDLPMAYTPNNARQKQSEALQKRIKQAESRTAPEDMADFEEWRNKELENAKSGVVGTVGDFIDHPELKAAYPELFSRPFMHLSPDHPKWTSSQDSWGYYNPLNKSIAINSTIPEKRQRETALHELQHAIQEIEGWQGGSSTKFMASRMAERDVVKKQLKEIQDRIDNMNSIDPVQYADLIKSEESALAKNQEWLNKTSGLEGVKDPHWAYEKAAGEEEARMVARRSQYPEEELKLYSPHSDFDSDLKTHLTNFATGGAVMMAGGKDVTKEAIKQGVKRGIDAVGNFLNSINPNDAIAREATRLQTVANPVKASVALDPYLGAYLKTVPYDRMKVDLSGLERGGVGFSGIQLADPLYQGAASGVTTQSMATRMINRNKNVPEGAPVIWTPSVGSTDQHKSNMSMFDKFATEFDQVKGTLSPELLQRMSEVASKAQKKGKLIFPQGMDFNDPNYKRIPKTYDQRAVVADIFSGKGVGGEKGKTVANYEQLLQDNLDPLVANVPTGSLGPRLFTLDNGVTIRPDLHRDYPFVLTGKDEGVTYNPVPREHVMTTFADVVQQLKGRPVTDMDYRMGDPTQFIDKELLNRLRDVGHAEGGEVNADEDGVTLDEFLSKQGY